VYLPRPFLRRESLSPPANSLFTPLLEAKTERFAAHPSRVTHEIVCLGPPTRHSYPFKTHSFRARGKPNSYYGFPRGRLFERCARPFEGRASGQSIDCRLPAYGPLELNHCSLQEANPRWAHQVERGRLRAGNSEWKGLAWMSTVSKRSEVLERERHQLAMQTLGLSLADGKAILQQGVPEW
jgi:hypothetical protein